MILGALLGLLPVMLFLAALVLLDGYKLIGPRFVLRAVGIGAGTALVSLAVNLWLLHAGWVSDTVLKRYAAPLVEESLKAVFVAHLVRRGRVGFMVDAAVMGFAVGAGFALVENLYYLRTLGGESVPLWVVRGFGTAMLHGSCTAIFGILAKDLSDRHESSSPAVFLPGLALAVAAHSLFNHFVVSPVLGTAAIVLVMPLIVVVVFERSERSTRAWLGAGFDADVELLEILLGEEVGTSRIGRYLETIRARFPGAVVADMLCLLRIHLELSLRAKGLLIARKAGLKVPVDEHVRANFQELKFLERAIGPTGLMAILPFRRTSARDLWQIYMLERESSRA